MSFGPSTQLVDGQRNLFPSSYAYSPSPMGPQTSGVPQVSPTLPPSVSAGGSGFATGAGMAGSENVDGYGTAGNNAHTTSIAAAHPFNVKVSPLWWAIGSLALGLVLLNGVHWRKTTLEGAEESAHIGPARESAGESV
jgi:hypothetical protein